MHLWKLSSLPHFRTGRGAAARPVRSRGRAARLQLEELEDRLNLSTYYWTALGDGTTWNDPANWGHSVPFTGMLQPGVPTAYSDVVFPPIATLPKGSTGTINFNFSYVYQPLDSITIQDSYTFEGTPVTIIDSLSASPAFTASTPTTASVLLSGLKLAPGAVLNASTGATLQLGSTAAPTGLQLTLEGSMTKTGGGQVVVDTQSFFYPTSPLNSPVPVTIAAGSMTLGETVNLGAINFQINSTAGLSVADDVSAQIRSITGTGLIDLEGTTATGDTTSLSVGVPNATTDTFGGFIQGTGQFIASGNGSLTTGTIAMSGTGAIAANAGTLIVNGSISAGTLNVASLGTFGGLGTWNFSGAVVFQPGSTFQVTLDGLAPSSQYTQLVDSSATSGVNLGSSTLTGVIGYNYELGDAFTIVSAPVIQGSFANVVAGHVLLGSSVPFGVTSTGTSVTLTALQSVTSTQLSSTVNPSNPGSPVTFTASVNTRTGPVSTGTVTFLQGTTPIGTAAVGPSGTASLTTSSLPLGSSTIMAVYNGASGNLGSTSSSLIQSVVPYSTVTTLVGGPNPSVVGQPVTLTATVVAGGAPVTSGTVSFRRGSQYLGAVALDASGMATLTVSSLAAGNAGIQAVFAGTPTDRSSVSETLEQTVAAAPTVTSLTLATQMLASGQIRYVLVAAVAADVPSEAVPAGTVVFRKNGKVIGKAKLKAGSAVLAIGHKLPKGKFVAAFQRTSQYKASTSPPLFLPS